MRSAKRSAGRPRARGTASRDLVLGEGRNWSIPPLITPLKLTHKFRFVSGSNSGAFLITRGNLLNMLLRATAATTSVRELQAVRLKSIEMWTNPPVLGGAPVSLFLEWNGFNSPSTYVTDQSMGVRPAHLIGTPPPESSNRWWSVSGNSESDVLFTITVPINSVIDVSAEVVMQEQESPVSGDAPTGATLGRLYGDYLDGRTTAKLAPVGYTVLP